jgi:hypothetical protein
MHKVVINEWRFTVLENQLDEIRDELIEAVRAGGAFVTLSGSRSDPVQVMVTPSTPVRIEPADNEAMVTAAGPATGEFLVSEVDWWLEWGTAR